MMVVLTLDGCGKSQPDPAVVDIAQTPMTIVGPADRDRVHSEALETAIQAAGLAGRVTLAGALNAAALDAAYHRADLFALASRYEGFGLPVLIESPSFTR